MIGQDNRSVRNLPELSCHEGGHKGAVAVQHLYIPVRQISDDLGRKGNPSRIAMKLLNRDAGIPDDGVRKALVLGIGTGRRDDQRVIGTVHQVLRVILNGIGYPIHQWRERIIQQADGLGRFHGKTSQFFIAYSIHDNCKQK